MTAPAEKHEWFQLSKQNWKAPRGDCHLSVSVLARLQQEWMAEPPTSISLSIGIECNLSPAGAWILRNLLYFHHPAPDTLQSSIKSHSLEGTAGKLKNESFEQALCFLYHIHLENNPSIFTYIHTYIYIYILISHLCMISPKNWGSDLALRNVWNLGK